MTITPNMKKKRKKPKKPLVIDKEFLLRDLSHLAPERDNRIGSAGRGQGSGRGIDEADRQRIRR